MRVWVGMGWGYSEMDASGPWKSQGWVPGMQVYHKFTPQNELDYSIYSETYLPGLVHGNISKWDDLSLLWPLLLTWFNFNPSMDK